MARPPRPVQRLLSSMRKLFPSKPQRNIGLGLRNVAVIVNLVTSADPHNTSINNVNNKPCMRKVNRCPPFTLCVRPQKTKSVLLLLHRLRRRGEIWGVCVCGCVCLCVCLRVCFFVGHPKYHERVYILYTLTVPNQNIFD